jgi:hypothetical protein
VVRRVRVRLASVRQASTMHGFNKIQLSKEGNNKMAISAKALETIIPVTNEAMSTLALELPYITRVTIVGTAPMLFHRWSVESVKAKGEARKGSAAKKSDDTESYVLRDLDGNICLPGEYLRMSVINAAKYRQDPRSPRKSAMDLYKAAIVSLTELAPLNGGVKEWDYLDLRRVVVQRNGITRARPAFVTGWTAAVDLMVNLPEYVSPTDLLEVLNLAGRLVGVGDFRPTFGRFQVENFELLRD